MASVRLVSFLSAFLLFLPIKAIAEEPEVVCDWLAAIPTDPAVKSDGVHINFIKFDKAIPACKEAIDKHPDNPRYKFQLSRALLAASQYEESLTAAENAVSEGYEFANVILGFLAGSGKVKPKDDRKATEYYFKAAKAGLPLAAYVYAVRILRGIGKPKDIKSALKWLNISAEGGYGPANAKLGRAYLKGKFVKRDYIKAKIFLEIAAKKGVAAALNPLGVMFNNGLGVPQDRKRAIKYFKSAIGAGLGIAHKNYGRLLESGRGVSKNLTAAEKHYRQAIKKGYRPAELDLAYLLKSAPELNGDPKEIANLFLSVSKRGNQVASVELGLLLIHGNGIEKDAKKGIEILKKAANSGRANSALFELGILYENGLGVPINLSEAFNWYSRAADVGDSYSKIKSAKMRIEGKGVPQDIEKGVSSLTEMAKLGSRDAQGKLGTLYNNGKYFPKNYSQAVHWFRQAAEQGDPYSISQLGKNYIFGLGVKKNVDAGIALMVRAAKFGRSWLQEEAGSAFLKVGKIDEGLFWLRKAAKQKYTFAQTKLGNSLIALKRSKEEVEEGLRHLINSAEGGYTYAQYSLGVAFQVGATGSKDLDRAFEWIEKAANADYQPAQNLLGLYYWNGWGASQDYKVAVSWFRRAVNKNDPWTNLMLGIAYHNGSGVPKSLEKAVEFYKAAADLKSPIAIASLALLNTTGEIQNADPIAADKLINAAIKISKSSTLQEQASVFVIAGQVSNFQGQYIKGEQHLRRAIKIHKSTSTKHSTDYITSLLGLVSILRQSGRYVEANNILKRSLSLAKEIEGSQPALRLIIQFNFASLMEAKGEFSSAIDRFNEVRTMLRFAPGVDAAKIEFIVIGSIGRILTKQEKLDEAEEVFLEAFNIITDNAIPTGPSILRLKGDYAQLLVRRGDNVEAEKLFRDIHKGIRKFKLESHPLVMAAMPDYVGNLLALNRVGEAQAIIEKSIAVYVDRISRQSRQSSGRLLTEKKIFLSTFTKLLGSLIDEKLVSGQDRASQDRVRNVELSFRLHQLIQTSRADRAVARMGARFASGDSGLAKLVRERQDSVDKWRTVDRIIFSSLEGISQKNKVNIESLGPKSERLKKNIENIDLKLLAKFPKYFELAAPKPLKIAAVQKLLNEDEALVSYLFGVQKSFVWLIRRRGWFATSVDMTKSDLEVLVRDLRRGLDPTGIKQLSQVPDFPKTRAFELYNKIFAPIEKMLKGVRHILAVSDGALQSLPLGVLVTEKPQGSFTDFSGYRQVPWLAKKYAISVLPSVNSLKALRAFTKDGRAKKPFIGFGAPTLNGPPNGSRGVKVANLFSRGSVADSGTLQSLGSLPKTADELRSIAKTLGADKSSVYLGSRATETLVKTTDLSKVRVLAFATHGLIAGAFKGITEPGLVMTPPSNSNEYDDGYLTASEVAQLKLNADWVILSACDTAASNGDPGAEGLSGLARAFFYAGSRSLLVSHWPVLSEAAKKLTTKLFEEAKSTTIGRAEALRRSMITLMNSPDAPYLAHPMFWAPFSVVGEGN